MGQREKETESQREKDTRQRGYRWWRIVRQSWRPAAGVDVGDSSGSCGQSEGIVAMATGACVQTFRTNVKRRPYTHTHHRPSLYLNISAACVCVPMECANTCTTRTHIRTEYNMYILVYMYRRFLRVYRYIHTVPLYR